MSMRQRQEIQEVLWRMKRVLYKSVYPVTLETFSGISPGTVERSELIN